MVARALLCRFVLMDTKVDMLFMVAKVFRVIAEALLQSCHGVLGCSLVSKVF